MEFSNGVSLPRTLVIMAKAPKPGMVKTRLTQSLPLPAVTTLYCCLLEDTVALAQSLPGVEVALMCPGPDVDELARLLGSAVQIVAQNGEGLAAGLTSVFRHWRRLFWRVLSKYSLRMTWLSGQLTMEAITLLGPTLLIQRSSKTMGSEQPARWRDC
jgi:hypothetical protein